MRATPCNSSHGYPAALDWALRVNEDPQGTKERPG